MAIPLLALPAAASTVAGTGAAAAGAGAIGAGAAGAAGAGGLLSGANWSVILPVLMSIFGGLFEKKEEDPLTQANNMLGMMKRLGIQTPYQNPYLPQMGEAAFRGSLGQLGRTANWGWPEGMGIDMSWIQDMLANAPTGTPQQQRRNRFLG